MQGNIIHGCTVRQKILIRQCLHNKLVSEQCNLQNSILKWFLLNLVQNMGHHHREIHQCILSMSDGLWFTVVTKATTAYYVGQNQLSEAGLYFMFTGPNSTFL